MSVINTSIFTEASAYAIENEDDICMTEASQVALEEQFLIEECSRMTDDELRTFLESDLCETLVTEGKMRRNTIVLLSGRADMDRRTKMAALQMAKDKNDSLWAQLKKLRVKERKILTQIMRKYGHKSRKVARASQKDWIRNRMPANFGRFGGNARLSSSAPAEKMTGAKRHNDGTTW